MFLKSEKIYLRALEPADLDFLYDLENDVSFWHIGNTITPYSKQVLEQYLENATRDLYAVRQLRLLICTSEDQPVGAIDLYDFDPLHQRAGVGIVITADECGKGYGREALQLLLQYTGKVLQLHQLYCTITTNNAASLHLFSKAGFREVGIRKDWLRTAEGWDDVVEMQLIFSS